MIRSLNRIKAVATVLLLTLPMLAFGQNQSDSDIFIYEGSPGRSVNTYYYEIPGRFFIQRSADVSQDYIITLLKGLTDSPFESSWCSTKEEQDNLCRVIIDDALINNIIDELLKDDGVLAARRIYVKKKAYDDYVLFLKESGAEFMDFIDLVLKSSEIWLFNSIMCTPMNLKPESVPIDSICNALSLTYEMTGPVLINFKALKNSDIFEVTHKLFETGFFTRVAPDIIGPFSDMEMNFGDLPGSPVKISEHCFIYNSDGTKDYYYEIPDRLLICKNSEVSQEYVNSLLSGLIADTYLIDWLTNDMSEVIIGKDVNNIIDELLKDNGVSWACHIYVSKNSYYKYRYYPYLERYEKWLLNNTMCWFKDKYERTQLDNICEALNLTITEDNDSYVALNAPKNADMFEVLQKLYESDLFASISLPPMISHNSWTGIRVLNNDVKIAKAVYYYDMLGRPVETPSGLTIVVTRYSDGSVHTEKKLFR